MVNRKLKSIRALHNITQKDLSEILKVRINTYSMKERGILSFNEKEMLKIWKFFKENYDPNIKIMDIFFTNEVTQ